MSDEKRTASPWHRLTSTLDAQHGVISRQQMRSLGFRDGVITEQRGMGAFERDHFRDRELIRAGYAVRRVTHKEAEQEADAVAETIALRLGISADSPAPSGSS